MARNNKIQEEEVQKVPQENLDFNIDDSAEVPNVQLKEVEKIEKINTIHSARELLTYRIGLKMLQIH